MGRPFLGTRPFAVRLTPLERATIEAAAKSELARSPRSWAARVLWDRAVAVVGKDDAARIRLEVEAPRAPKIRRRKP